jgi:NADH-quinone oxidoreductase subunit L
VIVLLAVVGPLAAAASILLLRRSGPFLALLGALASAGASWITLGAVSGGARYAASYEWLPGLQLSVVVDPLAALLAATVATVGFFVLLYAVGYMEGEKDTVRFYAAMSFFLAAMQALVVAADWLSFLASWELIGLASYLLIGHWYQREDARNAAGRAFLTTRTTDLGLYLAVFLLVHGTGSIGMAETLGPGGPTGALATMVGLLLLLSAAGKAAQVPLQGWLMAAMAGPAPVSALLHSATLVAAGVILMVRAFPVLPAGVLLVVGTLGAVTAIVAGLTAVAQSDLKRLLAASTSSQLGLMLVGLGAGSPTAASFYLIGHAAMKSALFLAVGVFQHCRGTTELARLHGVSRERPLAFAGFAVAGLALAGLPPLAGFRAKDAVLAATLDSAMPGLLFPLAVAGSLLTAMYVARALRLLWQAPVPAAESGAVAAAADAVGAEAGAVEAPPAQAEQSETGARGGVWMSGGLVVMTLAAAVLGLLAGPVEELLDAELPDSMPAAGLGLVAAAVGLAAGWMLSADRLLGGLRPLVESGFRLADGTARVVVGPALRLAFAVSRLDNVAHDLVTGISRRVLATARRVSSLDAALHGVVEGAATSGLVAASAVRAADQEGIEVLIASLARGIGGLGRAARRLQSGLVHRELALTVGAVAGLLLLLALDRLFVPS